VPFFVEELTRDILESEVVDGARGREHHAPPLPLKIPLTLHDSLMARLDRLGRAKEAAQIGAAIGREFDLELLSAVSSLAAPALEAALQELTSAGLVIANGSPPHATYAFKHALVQDAAYESLLKSRRHQLHAKIARSLEESRPDLVASRPELLAHHHAAAGRSGEAAAYCLLAGQRALSRFAMAEAVEHLSRGLALNASLDPSVERDERELEIRVALGTACMGHLGWFHPRVEEALLPARQLCLERADTKRLLPVLWLLCLCSITRAHYDTARVYVHELLEAASRWEDPDLCLVGHFAAAVVSHNVGDFADAEQHAQEVHATYRAERHRCLAAVLNYDVKSTVLLWQSQWLWALGCPDQALSALEQHLAFAAAIDHPHDRSLGLINGSLVLCLRGEPDRQFVLLEEGAKRAEEFGIEHLLEGDVPLLRGSALLRSGRAAEAAQALQAGLAFWQAAGMECTIPLFKGMLATALAQSGDGAGALSTIDEALADVERTGERQAESELWRIKGDILQEKDDRSIDCEACYENAMTIAQSQCARGWGLRVATSLARLRRSEGRFEEARELLAKVYGGFTEGFDTSDLRQAKALLDELAG
jgi:predicted ATPase